MVGQLNTELDIQQLTRFNCNGSGSHEHDRHVALLHELASHATQNRPHGSATTVRGHHDQCGFVLCNHPLNPIGSFADAHTRID